MSLLLSRKRSSVSLASAASAACVVLAACGASGPNAHVAALRPPCKPDSRWTGERCHPIGGSDAALAKATAAVTAFDVDAALPMLDAVASEGPLTHAQNVQLWEQRAIALAYIEREAEAAGAFARLLSLAPAHLLPYTLSPKVTFVFERARRGSIRAPVLDLGWPGGQRVGAAIPVDVELVTDPDRLVHSVTLFARTRGGSWGLIPMPVQPGRHRVAIPAVAATQATAVEIYARGYDRSGNEVLAWEGPERPREIPLRYDPPPRWYSRWWVWGAVGTVAAVATGIGVWAATNEPPDRIDASVIGSRR